VKNIEEVIGYKFTDKSLLRQAFTHSSYVNEHGGDANERLEFLGDCILDFLVGEKLFYEYPTADEGELSEKRAARVSRNPLARIVDSLHLMNYLLIGAGVDKKNFSDKNRSNLFEAVVGAIYIDGGLEACKRFLERRFYPKVVPEYDYKSVLQKKSGDKYPVYSIAAENSGYSATVAVADKKFCGKGKTKHEAEIAAARAACKALFDAE